MESGASGRDWACATVIPARSAARAASFMEESYAMRAAGTIEATIPPVEFPSTLRSRASLGPLETRLLELLWERSRAATVRDLQRGCPGLAYTTILTTLDRLYRKGLLLRQRHGRAFAYEPRLTRDELLSELVSGHVTDLLGASRQSSVILSTLVRAVRDTDAALLNELDALIRAERVRLKRVSKWVPSCSSRWCCTRATLPPASPFRQPSPPCGAPASGGS